MFALYDPTFREELAHEREDEDQAEIDKLAAKHRQRLIDLLKAGDKPTLQEIDDAWSGAFTTELSFRLIAAAAAGEDAFGEFVHDLIAEKAYALACCEHDVEIREAANDPGETPDELLHRSALGD